VLYFELGNDTLTAESQQVLAILALVAERGQPDVAITGHTDTTGAAAANVVLWLRWRACARSAGRRRTRRRADRGGFARRIESARTDP
jgi:outer membrane protein OmpA-like peptidoglycan-associated protein